MGWLQGTRYQNNRQFKSYLSHVKQTEDLKPQTLHVEHIEDPVSVTGDTRGDRYNMTTCRSNGEYQRSDRGKEDTSIYRALVSEEVRNEDLPFIPKDEVVSKRNDSNTQESKQKQPNECIWIVVDNIVYDCSEFVADHPGGEQVIRSFSGEDCSWQFWRFHGKHEMDTYGHALRIGRTEKVPNRFQEPPRYVGLSRLGHDEW